MIPCGSFNLCDGRLAGVLSVSYNVGATLEVQFKSLGLEDSGYFSLAGPILTFVTPHFSAASCFRVLRKSAKLRCRAESRRYEPLPPGQRYCFSWGRPSWARTREATWVEISSM